MLTPPPLTAETDVIIEKEELKEEEDDASSETPPLFFSPPTPLAATTDIVTDVEAKNAKEYNTEKGDSAASETPPLLPSSLPFPLPPTKEVVTKKGGVERDDEAALEMPSFSLTSLLPPSSEAAADIITKEEADTTKGGR